MIDLISKLLGGIDTKAGRVLSLLIVAALAILGIILPADAPSSDGAPDPLNLEGPAGPTVYDPLAAADAVPTAVSSNASSFTAVVANDIEALDDLFVGDDATIADDVTLGGSLALSGAALSGFTIDATAIVTDTTLTAAQSSGYLVLKNTGTATVTLSLPAAAEGITYCVYNYDGDDISIDPATGDKFAILTDAAGDKLTNSTAGNHICFFAADATDWLAYAVNGTWSDGN